MRRFPSPRFQYGAAALVLFLLLLGTQLATPLYSFWRDGFGLGATAVTLVFTAYSIGVVLGLVGGGKLGDQLGRRPLILAACGLLALSALGYIGATGFVTLFLARLVSGLAIGLASGPCVAAIVELHPTGDRAHASWLGATATIAAPAGGLLVATLAVRFAPAEALWLPFAIQLAGLAAALALLRSFRETLSSEHRTPWRRLRYRPQGFRVPAEIRGAFTFAACAAFVCWSTTSLWLVLGPTLVADVLGLSSPLLGGLTVVVFLLTAGAIQALGRRLDFRRTLTLGLALSPPAFLVILATLYWHSALGLVAGAILAGGAQGLSWLGAVGFINHIAPGHQRSSILSGLYIAGYLGPILPVLGMGVVADLAGLLPAVTFLCLFLGTMGLVVAVWSVRYFRAERAAGPRPAPLP